MGQESEILRYHPNSHSVRTQSCTIIHLQDNGCTVAPNRPRGSDCPPKSIHCNRRCRHCTVGGSLQALKSQLLLFVTGFLVWAYHSTRNRVCQEENSNFYFFANQSTVSYLSKPRIVPCSSSLALPPRISVLPPLTRGESAD